MSLYYKNAATKRSEYCMSNVVLTKNQKIKLEDGRTVTVVGKLGAGGQGIAYRVLLDETGEEKALKWYFLEKIKNPKAFYNHLRENIKHGSPDSSFVWPEAVTEWSNHDEPFGYIMRVYPKEYDGFNKFLLGKVSFASNSALINAALNIVEAFKKLHSKGYNYQDLNDGNFAINRNTGDVLICDNDNAVGQGASFGILGKFRYMAPEIVRHEVMPSTATDRFSLAVVLFLLLMGGHPLEGAKTAVPALTDKMQDKFFGTEPVFIFDESISTNRPVSGLHEDPIRLWCKYPLCIRKSFCRSFSQESMLHGQGRLTEREWLGVLSQLKSFIVKCNKCGASSVILELTNNDGNPVFVHKCARCSALSKAPAYISFQNGINIPVFEGVKIYSCLTDLLSEDFNTPSAEFLVKSNKLGAQNLSQCDWIVTSPNGKQACRHPGEVAVLGDGFCIDFGGSHSQAAKVVFCS